MKDKASKAPEQPLFKFPDLFYAADEVAGCSQRDFYRLRITELLCLVGAAVSAGLPADRFFKLGPLITILLFLVALIIRISGQGTKLEKRWYNGRAAAESIKSMSWQYAVCGESYRQGDTDASSRFSEQLNKVLGATPHLDLPATPGLRSYSATESMRAIRDSPLSSRIEAYRYGRVHDQLGWYERKSRANKDLAKKWTGALVLLEAFAVLLGIGRIVEWFDVDWLGLLAAAATALAAWQQSKKYTELSEAYAITSHEVAILSDDFDDKANESEWAQQVHDSEAAFSREHTMWLARRQGPPA